MKTPLEEGPPPAFSDARNLRQKARAAGLDPNYWYPVERDSGIRPGEVREVVFWKHSIALFRGYDGTLRAIRNRCAHRQLKLSLGEVRGCDLVCAYHGWTYDGAGNVVAVPHDLFGRSKVSMTIPSYPVKVRYGLIWIFPGDPALAEERAIPDIPELEGPDAWSRVVIDNTWRAHHSIIIDNVSDFTHAHLHRKYQPFSDARLLEYETVEDRVDLSYEAKVGRGRFTGKFVDHKRLDTNHMDLCYDYPYQWSNTDDEIKHWLFVLPIDEHTSRSFFIFYFKSLKVPFLPVPLRGRALQVVLDVFNRISIGPLLDQDGVVVEAEQEAYDVHWAAPPVELNPVVKAFQELTVRKWQAYLEDSANDKGASDTGADDARADNEAVRRLASGDD